MYSKSTVKVELDFNSTFFPFWNFCLTRSWLRMSWYSRLKVGCRSVASEPFGHMFQTVKQMSSVHQVAIMLMYCKYYSKNGLKYIDYICNSYVHRWGTKYAWLGGRGEDKPEAYSIAAHPSTSLIFFAHPLFPILLSISHLWSEKAR